MTWIRAGVRGLSSRRALMVAMAVGVTLRLAAIMVVGTTDTDLYEFGTIAHNVEAGRGYSFYSATEDGRVAVDHEQSGRPLPSAFMPPVYTLTVAGALELTESDDGAVRLLQLLNIVAAAAAIALMYALATTVAGPVAGALAALALATYGAFVYQSTQTSASNLYIPLELGTLVLLLHAARSARLRWVVGAAAALGVVCLLRSEGVALIALGGAWLAWTARRSGNGRVLTRVSVFVVVAAALPAGWMLRNTAELGSVVPAVTTSGGFNFWIGNHEGTSGSQKSFPEESPALQERINRLPATDGYELERDRLYADAALEHVTDDPLAVITRNVKKLALMVTFDVYDQRSLHPLNALGWIVVASFGLLGIFRRRITGSDRVLLLGYLAFALLVPSVFFALARFKLAIEFPLIVFGAAHLAPVLARWSQGEQAREGRKLTSAPAPVT